MARRPTNARSAFGLGILRTMRGSLKRFAALATICALGVTMIVGLKIACTDLRFSADAFFDEQDLFDIRVMSTLGLTDEDVEALSELPGVEAAEGGYTETVYSTVGASSEKVDVKALSPSGTNEPRILEGNLPVTDTQVAVTRRYAEEAGVGIGDTVTFRGSDDNAEDASTVFARSEYTISGIVLDPTDINAGNGTMSFRSSGGAQYAFFVLPSAATAEAYTVVYLAVEGAEEPLCYTGTYDEMVDAVMQEVEGVREDRELARAEGLRADANEQIDEQEAEAQSQLDDAASQLDDAQAEIDAGAAELADGRAELSSQERSAYRQLADAQAQLDSGYAQLSDAQAQLDASRAQVEDGLSQMAAQLGCSVDGIGSALATNRDELTAGKSQLAAARSQITSTVSMLTALPYVGDAWPADAWSRLVNASSAEEADAAAAEVSAAIDPFVAQANQALGALADYLTSLQDEWVSYDDLPEEVRVQIDALIARAPEELQGYLRGLLNTPPAEIAAQLSTMQGLLAQFSDLAPGMAEVVKGELELVAGEAQLSEAEAAYEQLTDAQAQIESGQAEIDANRTTLDSGAAQLKEQRTSAEAQLEDARQQLAEGEKELADGQAELDEARATYERERADALALIADARDEVSKIDDATWYVQDRASLSSYASVESDASSIEAIGTVIPIVFFVVAVLISLTTMTRMVEEERGLIGLYKALGYGRARILSKYVTYAAMACLVGGIVGNVLGFVVLPLILFTIFSTMYALPAFLICYDVLYSLGSVALFAAGIVGATWLTCRRELRESPASLMLPKAPKAGSRIILERIRPLWRHLGFLNKVTARNIFRYKRRFLMTVLGIAGCTALLVCGLGIRDTVLSLSGRQYGDAGVIGYDLMAVTSADDLEGVATDLSNNDQVVSFVPVYVNSLTVEHEGAKESVQLVVVPDGVSLDGYVTLATDTGEPIDLSATGTAITKNAEQVMGVAAGSVVHVQDSTLAEADVPVGAIAQNYLGNTVFMTANAYEDAFGEKCGLNGLLAHLGGSADEQIALSERLSGDGRVLTVVSTAKLVRDFSSAFTLINTVVYVVIVLAAALSFTVVFTLSNTNISERERELATIKVLGFKRPEVRRYINKETLLLTGMGVVLGLPLGYALTRSLTWILRMPSLNFDTIVEPLTYVIAAALAFAFTLAVNQLTNRALDRIDMVGALKSAE